jgi:predicted Na+-dependent transporter
VAACLECRRKKIGGVSAIRAGLLFWIFLLFAAGFARYVFLARRDDDEKLALASAVAFLLMCALAVAEAFGWLW